jgi:hypothetical protein
MQDPSALYKDILDRQKRVDRRSSFLGQAVYVVAIAVFTGILGLLITNPHYFQAWLPDIDWKETRRTFKSESKKLKKQYREQQRQWEDVQRRLDGRLGRGDD